MRREDLRFKKRMNKDKKRKNEDEKEQSLESKETNLENQLKRALADYQNLEKRIVEEKASWIRSANRDLILKLLPVLDNLFLAQKHISDEGLNLSIAKFLQVLAEDGIERIETTGRDFDPHLMECVSVVAGEEGKVVEEVRSGYTLNDSVIRPAQVVVGSAEQNK